MADVEPPYAAHQSLYSGPQFHAAFQDAQPVSAGRQIAARFIEALIAGGLGLILIGALIIVPVLTSLGTVSVTEATLDPNKNNQTGILFMSGGIAALIVVLVALVVAGIFIWWLAARGNSIGNEMFGLRLVSTADGQPIGWGKALLWYAVVIIGSVVTAGILGLLFLLSPLFDTASGWNRAWQDQMVGAVLIDRRMGLDTFAR